MSAAKRSVFYRLYHGETAFDFIGRKRRWFAISGAVIAIGIVSLFGRGLNQGIDFKGGTSWEVKAPGVSVAKARSTMQSAGLANPKIQVIGADTLRVQADVGDGATAADKRNEVSGALSKLAGGRQVSENSVGPSWGKDVTRKAQRALVFFFVAIALYISLRFEYKMAIGALVAVVHDILVTLGVYSLVGFEVTPATVVAFLTILGYSIYDTIVVFDKVEENTRGLAASGRMTYSDMVNVSMNQVLMRSLNTSFVAILPISSVLFIGAYAMGATSLQDFGLALLVGLLTGAYSSIFVASPLLAYLKEREPRYAAIRQRIEARGPAAGAPLSPGAPAAVVGSQASGGGERRDQGDGVLRPKAAGGATATVDRPAPGGFAGTNQQPRGRKKGKRR